MRHILAESVIRETEGLDVPTPMKSSPSESCQAADSQPYLPILNTFVPQVGQRPWVAGLPFFMVILLGSLISFLARHFIQYACI